MNKIYFLQNLFLIVLAKMIHFGNSEYMKNNVNQNPDEFFGCYTCEQVMAMENFRSDGTIIKPTACPLCESTSTLVFEAEEDFELTEEYLEKLHLFYYGKPSNKIQMTLPENIFQHLMDLLPPEYRAQ